MTTVVAFADGQSVWMGADSCTNVYERPVVGGAVKIRRLDAGDDEVLLGVAGHGGLTSLLPRLTLPASPDMGEDGQSWAEAVAMTITAAAVERGLVENGQMEGHLLLGWRGTLWTIVHDMAIPHADGRAALGSGEGPAIGALDALLICDVPPAEAVRVAVEVACRRDRYSLPPVQLEMLEWYDPVQ